MPKHLTCATLTLLIAVPAHALEPLQVFVTAARSHEPSQRVAEANTLEQRANAETAKWALLPSFSARGVYTRNQYEVQVSLPVGTGVSGPLTIQPQNQLDAFLRVSVPVVDLPGWARLHASRVASDSARASQDANGLTTEQRVARAYYTLLGAEALKQAAQKDLALSQENTRMVTARFEGGVATDLDVQRAKAAVERAHQNLASAELQIALSQQSLHTMTGIHPSTVTDALPPDDLHDEPPLSHWSRAPERIPSVTSARAQTQAARALQRASSLALAPTLTAAVEERLTNATSFVGRSAYYTITGNAAWTFDGTVLSKMDATHAAAARAIAESERAEAAALDQIHEAWNRVRANIATSRAARAQAAAAIQAQAMAADRYQVGTATQLEVLEAQRDAFDAEVSRIQADAELAHSRVWLRLASGQSLAGVSR